MTSVHTLGRLSRPLSRLGVPGTFPVLVERLHARCIDAAGDVVVERDGARWQLDLGDYVQRRIFHDAFERDETAFVRSVVRPGDVVADVGANIGWITVAAALATGPRGRVHAFEPVAANRAALERNLAVNDLANVTVHPVGVSDAAGHATAGLPEPGQAMSRRAGTSGNFTVGGAHDRVDIELRTLDTALEGVAVRLLKVDVEGLEPEVLRGAEKLLAERPPEMILLELNRTALAAHGHDTEDVLGPLRAAGYGLRALGRGGRLRSLNTRRGLVNLVACRRR